MQATPGGECPRRHECKGADPNKVVQIPDEVGATTPTGRVAQETFKTVLGPTCGTVYRGVAYVGHAPASGDRDREQSAPR